MICNFGMVENLNTLESIVNLFNLSIVELVELQIKERVIYFNMISNKHLDFNDYLNRKTNKNSSEIINSTAKRILLAKLSKFDNKEKKATVNYSTRSLEKTNQNNNSMIIPNIKFYQKAIFKKTFTNFLKMAEDLKDGEIIYKI